MHTSILWIMATLMEVNIGTLQDEKQAELPPTISIDQLHSSGITLLV